jgi:serine/alanine adding enzyme
MQWDTYVENHAHGSVYHRYAFKQAVEETYGHKSLYLAAFDDTLGRIAGVLPLYIVSSLIFGKSLVSIPFCDYGGILYDQEQVGALLLEKALTLMKDGRYEVLELRQTFPLPFFPCAETEKCEVNTVKVRMKCGLPASSAALFESFPAKLRSQIRKPQKEGCSVKIGGRELLDDFYRVFVYNMRDLGSPVHPKKMMASMLHYFGERARLFVVYKDGVPVACSLVAAGNNALVNPWASFNKTYRACAPNMLLYWSMLEFAIANKYSFFDFGRSTRDEGTYRFKEQWGAVPEPLTWYFQYRDKKPAGQNNDKKNKERFIAVWRKLPLVVTQVLGPVIRRHIPL